MPEEARGGRGVRARTLTGKGGVRAGTVSGRRAQGDPEPHPRPACHAWHHVAHTFCGSAAFGGQSLLLHAHLSFI